MFGTDSDPVYDRQNPYPVMIVNVCALSATVLRDRVKSEKSGTCLKNSISSYFVQRYLIVSQ